MRLSTFPTTSVVRFLEQLRKILPLAPHTPSVCVPLAVSSETSSESMLRLSHAFDVMNRLQGCCDSLKLACLSTTFSNCCTVLMLSYVVLCCYYVTSMLSFSYVFLRGFYVVSTCFYIVALFLRFSHVLILPLEF